MNRHATLFAIALSALAATGCKREAEAPPAPEAAPAVAEAAPAETPSAVISEVDHNSPASMSPGFDIKAFVGTFAGTVPCASCPGIDMRLALAPDGVYTLQEVYQGEKDGRFDGKGTWTVEADGTRLRLDPDSKADEDRMFAITGKDQIDLVGADGKVSTQVPYTLKRVAGP